METAVESGAGLDALTRPVRRQRQAQAKRRAGPQTRVAVLAFDKLDVEKGMEIRDPAGATRWLKHPWSVLAFQIAGTDGLRLLHAEGKDQERDSAPAGTC